MLTPVPRRHRNVLRLGAGAALACVAVAACSGDPGPTPSATPVKTSSGLTETPTSETPAPTADVGVADEIPDLSFASPLDDEVFVSRLAGRETPAGTTAAIALRFVRALERDDWRAAAVELNLPARHRLSFRTPAQVVAVLADVRDNAGGDQIQGCDTARVVKSDAVVVTCTGGHRVVVHVQNLVLRGVQIAAEHPRDDVVSGPHAHAFSALAP